MPLTPQQIQIYQQGFVQRQTQHQQQLEQRRQQAIAIAKRCTKILKQEFGAREVILFGSLRGDSLWHEQSDLDLAVSGLSGKDILKVYLRLEKVVPSWLAFDIVEIESVPDYVRAQIFQENPMPENLYLALKARIEAEMMAIEETIARIIDVLAQVDTIPEIALTPALASYVADFYKGCERIGERIAVSLDGSLPKGENWHQALLQQMAEPGGKNRPALWQGALILQLNEYRSFRHIDRHRYKINLELKRVLELAQEVQPVFAKIQTAIAQFNTWLEQQAQLQE